MKAAESELQGIVSGVCLIAAPLLMLTGNILRFALDNFHLWHPTLNIIVLASSIPAILGLKYLLRFRAPRLAVLASHQPLLTSGRLNIIVGRRVEIRAFDCFM